jgi:hypothetical protein
MTNTACEICGGAGTYEKDGKSIECECSLWTRIGSSMPPYILSARFLPQHLESPLLRCFDRSCFVIGSWIDLRAIIKATMMKYHGKFFRITSDREALNVFLGSKSKASLQEDAKVVYNSVEDLMGGGDQKGRSSVGPDLVILRLNELGYKNEAAPGILEEAIGCRLDYGKATWVLSDLDKPFGSGSFSYSDAVWDMLHTSFIQVRVPRITPRSEVAPPVIPNILSDVEDEEPNHPVSPVKEKSPARSSENVRRTIQSVPDEDSTSGLGMYGAGLSNKKRFGPKKSFGGRD